VEHELGVRVCGAPLGNQISLAVKLFKIEYGYLKTAPKPDLVQKSCYLFTSLSMGCVGFAELYAAGHTKGRVLSKSLVWILHDVERAGFATKNGASISFRGHSVQVGNPTMLNGL
jgi:hypothetical protein